MENNKVVSYLVVIVSILILFTFTKSQIDKIQLNLDNKEELTIKVVDLEDKLKKIEADKIDLKKDISVISKYTINFSEDELINYLYSYAERVNGTNGNLVIRNISFSSGVLNDFGFMESNIDLSVKVGSEQIIKNFLDFLTSPTSKYSFFINNFTYPNDGRTGDYTISIPLKIFYKTK